jgi:dTDP-4-dehydrorhamnose 3,5-epimerase/CDP-3, 6-dideoxy-D-glycero-D-glycero-4-hexulose-5-epimerase
MHFQDTSIPNLQTFQIPCFLDERGAFQKLFHASDFAQNNFPCEIRETFFTVSKKNVLRGMHFQLPPAAHIKLVSCLSGKILDVLLDVRKKSPTYGKFITLELSDENLLGVAVPIGIAHGFLVLSDSATVHYQTSHEHSPQNDSGIRWDSFGMSWPTLHPIISTKDAALKTLQEFQSPF